jgi:hypothetical protein
MKVSMIKWLDPAMVIDKVLLLMDRSIRRAFFACQVILCIEKLGPVMRLVKEGGSAAALLRNQLTFWSSHPARGHFEHNSDRPLLHASNSPSVMPEYIRPRSIQGLDKGDRH